MSGNSKLLKVVLLGDGGVGKSSLMNRFVSNKFDSQSFHTIGVEFLNKDVLVDNEKYTMQVCVFKNVCCCCWFSLSCCFC